MAQFRSRPVLVDAEQFTERHEPRGLCRCVAGATGVFTVEQRAAGLGIAPHCHSKQGVVGAIRGDWIIAEPDGSGFYPCAAEVFERKYEPILYDGAELLDLAEMERQLRGHDPRECLCSGCALRRDRAEGRS